MTDRYSIQNDIINMTMEKLSNYSENTEEFEKIANKLRDMIAMGRTPILQQFGKPNWISNAANKVKGFFGNLFNGTKIPDGADKLKNMFDDAVSNSPGASSIWGGLKNISNLVEPTEEMKRLKSFKVLRNTKLYKPYQDYKNIADAANSQLSNSLDTGARATALRNKAKAMVENNMYEQDLRRALRDKIRGKKNYNDFMQNTLGATLDRSGNWVGGRSLTPEEYAKYFEDRTAYPSLKRVAEGTITGVKNRLADTNRKIRALNDKRVGDRVNGNLEIMRLEDAASKLRPDDKSRAAQNIRRRLEHLYGMKERGAWDAVPELSMSGSLEELSKHLGLSIDELKKLGIAGSPGFTAMAAKGFNVDPNLKIYGSQDTLPVSYMPSNPTIHIHTSQDVLQDLKNKLITIRHTIAPNDPHINGADASLAAKALTLDHEFNEALNMLDLYKRHGARNALKSSIISGSPLLGDTHMSGSVLGNEFITANRLYGSNVGSPLFEGRVANNKYPDLIKAITPYYYGLKNPADINFKSGIDTAISNFQSEHHPGLTANTIGMDVTKLDGGFGDRFKTPRQLRRYLNKTTRNTNDMTSDAVNNLYLEPRDPHQNTVPLPFLNMSNEEKMILLNKYFPDMKWAMDTPAFRRYLNLYGNRYKNSPVRRPKITAEMIDNATGFLPYGGVYSGDYQNALRKNNKLQEDFVSMLTNYIASLR